MIPSVAPIRPKFQGVKPNSLLAMMPTWQRRLAQVVNFNEGRAGLSNEKFAQATLAFLLPKWILSRSKIEAVEVTFQELIESAFFYYSTPLMATFLFEPMLHGLMPKGGKLPKSIIRKSFADVAKKDLPKFLPVKTGIIMASLSMIPMVYSLNFVKNLLTEKAFRKSKFSDVVNLSNGKLKEHEESPVAKKAYRRIKQCWGIAGGMIAGGMTLAAFGHRLPALKPLLCKAVKFFDLTHDGKMYGLSLTQLIALWWINGYSYVDAGRDKLEKVEVGIRALGVTTPFMYPISNILWGSAIRSFGKKTPMLLQAVKPADTIENRVVGKLFGQKAVEFMNLKNAVKSLPQLQKDVLAFTAQQLNAENPNGFVSKSMLLQKSKPLMEKLVRAKNFLYWMPFAVGVFGTGLTVGLLNRHYTSLRYKNSIRQNKETETEMRKILPLSYSANPGISPWNNLPAFPSSPGTYTG